MKFITALVLMLVIAVPVFAEDVTRRDVEDVVYEVIELLDFEKFLTAAELTSDDIVSILWYALATVPQEREWAINRHRENWLFEETYDFFSYVIEIYEHDEDLDFAIVTLRYFHVFAQAIPILGYDETDELFLTLERSLRDYGIDYDDVMRAIAGNHQFIQILNDFVAEYGVDYFLDIIWYGSVPKYRDMLLGGLVSRIKDVTRDDVADAVVNVFTIFRDYYDFEELLNIAGLGFDDFVDIIWYLAVPDRDEVQWFIRWHGESWLFYLVYELVDDIVRDVEREGEEMPIAMLQALSMFTRVVPVLGFEGLTNLFDVLDRYVNALGLSGDDFMVAATENHQFAEMVSVMVVAHGVEEFLGIINAHPPATAFAELVEHGTKSQGLVYMDMLLGGLLSQNIEGFSVSRRDLDNLSALFNFWDSWDYLGLPFNLVFIGEDDLERRFSHNVHNESAFEITLQTPYRLNLHLQNNSDTTLYISYFAISMHGGDILKHNTEIAPLMSYTSQINFQEPLLEYGFGVHVFILGEADMSFDFAYRLTNYPLGHPSHG
ncbi:MAG: hypothetical protein FWF78_02610 [Defluviitaleaceae bacterium]|nr:hypothetical protein [Defluviitaleaceae bacterium]